MIKFNLFDYLNNNLPLDNLCDLNIEFINCLQVLKENPDELISNLKSLSDQSKYMYYMNRKYYNYLKKYNHHCFDSSCSRCEKFRDYYVCISKASLFIYLNMLCYNNLYKETNKGVMISSYSGKKYNVKKICKILKIISSLLKTTVLSHI
jgi:site-specific DNA-adenine methylase